MPRFSSSRAVCKIFIQAAALLLLAGFQYDVGLDDRKSRKCGNLIAAALAITAFNYESGGDFTWRYNLPQFFTAIVVFYAAQAALRPESSSNENKKQFMALPFSPW